MPARPATEVVVTVDGSPDPTLRVHSVFRGTGGALKDQAVIEVDLSQRGTGASWLQNIALNSLTGAKIQVFSYPFGAQTLLHSGTAVAPSIQIGEQERLLFTSRVEPWHFGVVMNGVFVWEPLSGQILTVLDECVFNPEIDGEVLPNQSQLLRQNGLAPVMLDPESCRTTEAIAVQGDSPTFWTPQTAVAYLCWALNPDQLYVSNPTGYGLLPSWPLQNFSLPRGKFLSDYLDQMLPRWGLTWGLDLTTGVPTIAFVVRGLGTANSVYLGAPGSPYAGDNAAESALEYDVGTTRNQAVVQGDWAFYESTFVLSRAWAADLDDTPETSLSKDAGPYNDSGENLRDVWRKWVLDTAGDYVGLRPENSSAYDLAALFGHAVVPRRRRFWATITLDDDLAPYGAVDGIDVQFSTDGGETWKAICQLEDRTCVVLDRECGIRFDGFFPPAELVRAANKAQVRVTATLRDDVRLGTVVGPDASSPLAAVAPFYLDESRKFHYRQVLPSSRFYQNVVAGELPSAQADDTLALAAYAAWLQDTFDIADVHGTIVLEGLDVGSYNLGDLITAVNGRNISLSAQSAASGAGRCPQVVGITYDCQRQQRTLSIETFRDEGLAEKWAKGERQ